METMEGIEEIERDEEEILIEHFQLDFTALRCDRSEIKLLGMPAADVAGETSGREPPKESEMRKIYSSAEKLHNNQSLTESEDLLGKRLISNYCFSSCLLERGIEDDINQDENALKRFKDSLEKELDFLTHDVEQIVKKMNKYKDLFNSLETNISNLNSMMESSQKENPTDKNMDVIRKNIKMRFKKEKSDLKTIMTSLFADNFDIQDLFARIIEHHLKEGCDKYMELEYKDNLSEQIELLKKTNLFEVNPHDPFQIRLADLV